MKGTDDKTFVSRNRSALLIKRKNKHRTMYRMVRCEKRTDYPHVNGVPVVGSAQLKNNLHVNTYKKCAVFAIHGLRCTDERLLDIHKGIPHQGIESMQYTNHYLFHTNLVLPWTEMTQRHLHQRLLILWRYRLPYASGLAAPGPVGIISPASSNKREK